MKIKYIGRFVMMIAASLIPSIIEYFVINKLQAKEKEKLARSTVPKSTSEAVSSL
jgi:hypothetical protein